ncbi:MAG: GNAT family N-acetyltransferase [Acidobacteria bacterium]|nr:GNAT family N-acetyltransferase [Acidobacteriota bacterium]
MIRRMTTDDIPAGMRLKETANWNQTAQDWENVLALEPQGCWVYEAEGKIVGSTTAVTYGEDLAWIGMVLVLPEYRGRGIARALMEHALRYLDARGVKCVKLDATDMGRPLYERLGFVEETSIERWAGTLNPTSPPDDLPVPAALVDVEPIAALDRAAFGADRSRLLGRLSETFPQDAHYLPGGYLMGRPGVREYFLGPCVADHAAGARRLIAHCLSQYATTRMFWDLLPANQDAVDLARSFGFEPQRKLARMTLKGGVCQPGNVSQVFAAAGFEYG